MAARKIKIAPEFIPMETTYTKASIRRAVQLAAKYPYAGRFIRENERTRWESAEQTLAARVIDILEMEQQNAR